MKQNKQLVESLESRFLLAADLLLDMRVDGTGGKSASVQQNGTITLDLFALVRDGNSNTDDDGIQVVEGSFKSATGGLLADMASPVFTSPLDNSFSQHGTISDLDSDGDKDVGSVSSNDSTPYYIGTSGVNAAFDPKTVEVINGVVGSPGTELEFAL